MAVPHGIIMVADDKSKPPSRECGTSLQLSPTTLTSGTGIALRCVPNRDYKLRLFIENEEVELQTQDNQSWTPAQRPYVPFSSLGMLDDDYAFVEVFLRHQGCASRSK